MGGKNGSQLYSIHDFWTKIMGTTLIDVSAIYMQRYMVLNYIEWFLFREKILRCIKFSYLHKTTPQRLPASKI